MLGFHKNIGDYPFQLVLESVDGKEAQQIAGLFDLLGLEFTQTVTRTSAGGRKSQPKVRDDARTRVLSENDMQLTSAQHVFNEFLGRIKLTWWRKKGKNKPGSVLSLIHI